MTVANQAEKRAIIGYYKDDGTGKIVQNWLKGFTGFDSQVSGVAFNSDASFIIAHMGDSNIITVDAATGNLMSARKIV